MAPSKAAKKSPAKKRAPRKKLPAEINAWEQDPGQPSDGYLPIKRPRPTTDTGTLPVVLNGRKIPPGVYNAGTAEFRYWSAAEALARGAEFWAAVLPAGVRWNPAVGAKLPVNLDHAKEDFNAYYDRAGLQFFHGTIGGVVVYSGESPDVATHELGHAVLDAIRPELWDANFIEAAAFHESFGDMSALLSALQLRTLRQSIITETAGHLYRSTRLSRLAEQLGWAIRQISSDAVDRDCLRNAVNSLFYQDPHQLPPSGPATALSSEPHSFSRVFTAAFFEGLAGVFASQAKQDEAALLEASATAARLLVEAVAASPIVPSYYSQMAAHMIEADQNSFNGRYGDVLRDAFVRHGILSLDSAHDTPSAAAPAVRALGVTGGSQIAPTSVIALPGHRYGLTGQLVLDVVAEPKRFSVASAGPDLTPVEPPDREHAVRSFVDDLFRRGRVDLASARGQDLPPSTRPARHSHVVTVRDGGLTLQRRFFDCGLGG